MRAYARGLVSCAETVAQLASRSLAAFQRTEFEGPAANRLGAEVNDETVGVTRTADRLFELAALLSQSASDIERAQAERARLMQRAEAEAAAAKVGSTKPASDAKHH